MHRSLDRRCRRSDRIQTTICCLQWAEEVAIEAELTRTRGGGLLSCILPFKQELLPHASNAPRLVIRQLCRGHVGQAPHLSREDHSLCAGARLLREGPPPPALGPVPGCGLHGGRRRSAALPRPFRPKGQPSSRSRLPAGPVPRHGRPLRRRVRCLRAGPSPQSGAFQDRGPRAPLGRRIHSASPAAGHRGLARGHRLLPRARLRSPRPAFPRPTARGPCGLPLLHRVQTVRVRRGRRSIGRVDATRQTPAALAALWTGAGQWRCSPHPVAHTAAHRLLRPGAPLRHRRLRTHLRQLGVSRARPGLSPHHRPAPKNVGPARRRAALLLLHGHAHGGSSPGAGAALPALTTDGAALASQRCPHPRCCVCGPQIPTDRPTLPLHRHGAGVHDCGLPKSMQSHQNMASFRLDL
ncbi:hypothetical protein J437_LFUL016654 [Ladona fulva]|uniref:Uncharacterized protein n=1 Tax=Ladona fulva TaxID=123851 RepID=A0A8K0P761_LADFU|nr:hypothetical protein J437_LFUL016654 [Ladona fulva]